MSSPSKQREESGLEDDDDVLSVLDMLNLKVTIKSPGDPGYHEDNVFQHPLSPSSPYEYYEAEFSKLQNELDEWKDKAVKYEHGILQLEERLGHLEKENKELRCRVTQQQKEHNETQRKLWNERRSHAKCKQDLAEKARENSYLQTSNSIHSDQLTKSQMIIREMQFEMTKKDALVSALQLESDQVKNDLVHKSHELSAMNSTHQTQMTNLQSQITYLEQFAVGKERDIETLRCNLQRGAVEKSELLNLWQRLNNFIKGCNEQLEVNISLLVRDHGVQIPSECGRVEGNAHGEDGEKRLMRNLRALSFLVKNALERFVLPGQQAASDCLRKLQRNGSITLSGNDGAVDGTSASLESSCTITVSNQDSVEDDNEHHHCNDDIQQTQQLQNPDFCYQPIYSPVTPKDGSLA